MKRAQIAIVRTLITEILPPDDPHVHQRLSENANVIANIPELVAEFPDLPWHWATLSRLAPAETIVHNPDLPWTCAISRNKNITESTVLAMPTLPWMRSELSGHPNITLPFLLNGPWSDGDRVDWAKMSQNANVTVQFVKEHVQFPWNYEHLSDNEAIPVQDALANPYLPWVWSSLSKRATIEHLRQPAPWDFTIASAYSRLEARDVLSNPNLPWVLDKLALNVSFNDVDIAILYRNFRCESFHHRLFRSRTRPRFNRGKMALMDGPIWDTATRPDLRFWYIRRYTDCVWNYANLAANDFADERDALCRKYEQYDHYARRYLAAFRIQRFWRKITSDPVFYTCHCIQSSKLSLVP